MTEPLPPGWRLRKPRASVVWLVIVAVVLLLIVLLILDASKAH